MSVVLDEVSAEAAAIMPQRGSSVHFHCVALALPPSSVKNISVRRCRKNAAGLRLRTLPYQVIVLAHELLTETDRTFFVRVFRALLHLQNVRGVASTDRTFGDKRVPSRS